METKENKINSVDPDEIVQTIMDGAQVYSTISAKFIQNFAFYERTLYEWADLLMVKVPPAKDLDPIKFREVMIQLAKNVQIANNYYSVSCTIEDAISGGNSIKKSDVTAAIVQRYASKGAKRPAATVIDQMAESYMSSTISARVSSKMVTRFWKQRLEMLLEVRKIMEQISMSIHVEMKWTGQ